MKNINYLTKTFDEFKSNLQTFASNYFPDNYNNFSGDSIGNMFLEMSSYVGDVLSFYTDNQIQENFLSNTSQLENLYKLAYTLGYFPKLSYPAVGKVTLYQVVPIMGQGVPNTLYSLKIPQYFQIKGVNNQYYSTLQSVDFSNLSYVTQSYYDSNNILLSKDVDVISAQVKSVAFNFGDPLKFNEVVFDDNSFLKIIKTSGSNGSVWNEVPYLSQASIISGSVDPTNMNYYLNWVETPNRFCVRLKDNDSIAIQFGAGIYQNNDLNMLPNPDNFLFGTADFNFNKKATYFTQQYGSVPSNMTLYVDYLSGGGVLSNLPINSLNVIDNYNGITCVSPVYLNISLSTLYCNNSSPITGGNNGDTIDQIKINTMGNFNSQLRAVTSQDYISKIMSMPSEFGFVYKGYAEQGNDSNSINIYVLSKDNTGITLANNVLKQNIANFLNPYRMLTDTIYIKDAYYINLQVFFDIYINSNTNNNLVLNNCQLALINYFNVDNFQINQPINIGELYSLLNSVKGVQNVSKITLKNVSGDNYSPYIYDVDGAIRNNILYPSIDPSIFEVRFPDNDIQGRILNF